MINKNIIDIKSLGISQDIKEIRNDGTSSNQIRIKLAKIKSNRRAREKQYVKEDIKKRPTQELIENKGEIKRKAYTYGSKVESGIEKGLATTTHKLGQLAKQRVISRKVLKKSRMSYTIPDRKVENVFNDENRFFKGAVASGFI